MFRNQHTRTISSRRLIHLHNGHLAMRLRRFTTATNNTPLKMMQDISVKSPPQTYRIICIATGVSITGLSLLCLGENLLFGTCAGIVAKTSTAPLERLTTHRQASIDTKYSLSSVVKEIYKEEGIFEFWRGNGLNVFRASIKKGSLFALNDFYKSLIINNRYISNSINININKESRSQVLSFTCGTLSGLTSTLITYPLDVVKTVNQSTIHKQKWPSMTIWYSLSQNRGYLLGPWIAGLPTVIGTSIYYGCNFLTFDVITKKIDMMIANEHNINNYNINIPNDIKNAFAGFFSGIIGTIITYPNNCITKRMQTAHVCQAFGIKSQYNAQYFFQTMFELYYNEGGIYRLYRGFLINLCRNAPNTAIQFAVYKKLQRLWKESQYINDNDTDTDIDIDIDIDDNEDELLNQKDMSSTTAS